ncbi:protein translocase subunit SecDF [Kiritimatiella glycovorans]|uniref:Multifunctional fusion protein n=1 Tax=Kiritimatiella glycovorans TaxID=1307763 RepID=A0A0G3EIR9_9BACT|nr:protein translocase subunit SecDF [Kiritimatiella glycovorans]AKJ64064.1 bifunctional preprotein translocase subunit SecD/SecF [Kiritimatiella glycovorans]
MERNTIWKWVLLAGLTLWSLVLVTPLEEKVKLGLDLRGGTSFVLQVDMEELSEDEKKDAPQRALEVIRNRVDSMGIEEPNIYLKPRQNRIVVQLPGLTPEDRDRALDNLKSVAFLEFRMVHDENRELVNRLFANGWTPPGHELVELERYDAASGQSWKEYLFRRTEKFSELGEDRIEALRRARRDFHAPAGYELLLEEVDRRDETLYKPYYVKVRPELTGEYLKHASVDYRQLGQAVVTLSFDARGAKRFGRVTADYAPGGSKNPEMEGRRQLAIVLDNKLYSAPTIDEPIYGGNAVIRGNFKPEEAQDLALILRAGSLPAPVELIEERSVDPTLGRDSIRSGTRAVIFGGIAVLIFVIAYYFMAGVIADAALVLDLLLLPLGMWLVSGFLGMFAGSFEGGGAAGLPVLTLPGIAAIVLTIGMAVDANVLIFERIREELKAGKTLRGAISAGYEKVFSTIFDANLTTLLTALILFWQGSGPIRGFAVILSAGIVVSMFVALVATRMFLNVLAQRTKAVTLRMLSIVKKADFNFLGRRRIAGFASLVLLIITWAVFGMKGAGNFGVDFTGGSSITFSFDRRVPVQDVRETLDAAGVEDAQIQYQQELTRNAAGETPEYLQVKVPYGKGENVRELVTGSFESAGFEAIKVDRVGPQIGAELQRKGVLAIGTALLGIIIYISIRFEFAFAIGAIVALAHDVLMTVGLYCLFGRQLSLPVIAALLTIVGYSVNDTIVVFDRIREDLGLIKGRPYSEIANLSINQTLSRTLLTSITTLIAVLALLLFGGGAINDFALTLLIGVLVGTYSSIFVATPTVLLWHPDDKKSA